MDLIDKLKKGVDLAERQYAIDVKKYQRKEITKEMLSKSLKSLKQARFLLKEIK